MNSVKQIVASYLKKFAEEEIFIDDEDNEEPETCKGNPYNIADKLSKIFLKFNQEQKDIFWDAVTFLYGCDPIDKNRFFIHFQDKVGSKKFAENIAPESDPISKAELENLLVNNFTISREAIPNVFAEAMREQGKWVNATQVANKGTIPPDMQQVEVMYQGPLGEGEESNDTDMFSYKEVESDTDDNQFEPIQSIM